MACNGYRRFKTGEPCVEAGLYEFDGYLDGSSELLPFLDEMEIELKEGEVFPALQKPQRACYWQAWDGCGAELYAGMEAVGA